MRVFTLVVSFLLLGLGAFAYHRWEDLGLEIRTITLAIPAFVGGGMLLGLLLSLLLRRTGLQVSFLAALLGAGLGVGRLIPDYLKETLDLRDRFTQMILAMAGVCLLYVLVSVVGFVFRKRPVRKEKKSEGGSTEPQPAAAVVDP
jgi:peptidoglycan/LPS O-acetylase OafA/YrhL